MNGAKASSSSALETSWESVVISSVPSPAEPEDALEEEHGAIVHAGAFAPAEDGARLDVALKARTPLSRARLQGLIKAGRCAIDGGEVAEPARRVKSGEAYRLIEPPAAPAAPVARPMPLDILHEDEALIVLEKPAGLVVHPAPGHVDDTLVNALLAHCGDSLSGIGGVARPGVVHRLDRDVSGVMVVAKSDRAHQKLAGLFAVHAIERVYQAIAWGAPSALHGVIDAPIGRAKHDRKKMAVTQNGKRAVTHWKALRQADGLSQFQVELETGRTHQIRVHLRHLGCPILGDPVYKPRSAPKASPALRALIADAGRIFLHAAVLGFPHPISGAPLRFERPPPALFDRAFEAAGGHAMVMR